jgi:hypothetical protein
MTMGVEQSVELLAREPKYSEKRCPAAALSAHEMTWDRNRAAAMGKNIKKGFAMFVLIALDFLIL